jgi:hypothetical protein
MKKYEQKDISPYLWFRLFSAASFSRLELTGTGKNGVVAE